MPTIRLTAHSNTIDKGIDVEYFDESGPMEMAKGLAKSKFKIGLPTAVAALESLVIMPPRAAEANPQMAGDKFIGVEVRPSLGVIMLVGQRLRIATRFEQRAARVLVAPGERDVKPHDVTLPSHWWITDYDKTTAALLYYALAVEVNELTGDEMTRKIDPEVCQWPYGNSDPGGRICWGQTGTHVKAQSVREIDDLFFGTPFNNHLFYRPWPVDGNIPKDLDPLKGQRLSLVMKGEGTIVLPTQRQRPVPATGATQQRGQQRQNAGDFTFVIDAEGHVRPADPAR